MLPPLRPIQYTGALLEDWVVSRGALVEGASGMVPPVAGTEATVPVGAGPPSAVQAVRTGTSTRIPARTAGRRRPMGRPALSGTEVSGTVLPLSFHGVAGRSPWRPGVPADAGFPALHRGGPPQPHIRLPGPNCNGNDMRPI